jgi:hypothetical protein
MKSLKAFVLCTVLATLGGCAVEYAHPVKSNHYKVEHDSRTRTTPDVH